MSNNISNCIVYTQLSDHFPTFSLFSQLHTPIMSNYKTITYRQTNNNENKARFRTELENANWQLVYDSRNFNEALVIFQNQLKESFDNSFPLLTKNIKHKHLSKPYITNEIKSLIKERNKLQRKFLKWPITYGKQYRKLRNRISQMIQNEKGKYYKAKLLKSKSDVKKSRSRRC